MNTKLPERMDRRAAIKWMLAAGAGSLLVRPLSFGDAAPAAAPAATPSEGYGSDPDLMKEYKPGDYWPLTFTDAQRHDAAALCDVIIPADATSPSASSLGVTDFVDEWVSAPYPANVADRKIIMDGMAWLAAESAKRFGTSFAGATEAQRLSICDEMAAPAPEKSPQEMPAKFFKRYRNLTSTGFYTTPVGMKDLGYVGNLPSATFDGPPADLVAKLGLTDEVKW
jgi:hypothetical protein